MPRRNGANLRFGGGLTLVLVAGGLFGSGDLRAEGGELRAPEKQSAEIKAISTATREVEESRDLDDHSRPSSRLMLPRHGSSGTGAHGSDAWYLALASIAVVIAAAGGLAVAARRIGPRPGAGALHVLSRVSLSPKHTVYLLRAGGRVLLVGTGPQGAPALISELDDIPAIEPARAQGEAS